MNTTTAAARRSCYVEKSGLGRVTITMSREDAAAYIAGAEANGGTGYTIVDLGPFA